MIGAIIGDIVGSRSSGTITPKYQDFELFHPESRYIDDTVCSMAVADWIVNVNEWGLGASAKFALVLQSWCMRYPMGITAQCFADGLKIQSHIIVLVMELQRQSFLLPITSLQLMNYFME